MMTKAMEKNKVGKMTGSAKGTGTILNGAVRKGLTEEATLEHGVAGRGQEPCGYLEEQHPINGTEPVQKS